ncbi:zinc transporter 1 isoform X1 [Brachionus plicatilis]|uniref:Zinc transporter 1 isoform X1 n=1 Tax=Brachionus plicatilis TaxID=10195 RepID=A0A3M7QKY2_BRAPC|nr:zinc transporter 1 isoform X1 [Brachionus plicatilis]
MENIRPKLLLKSVLLLTCILTLINFVTCLLCHSSVVALTALINLSQFNFYLIKARLLNYRKKNGPKSSRFGILVDLISSIFVCAVCFSTLIKSIQKLLGHHSIHDIDEHKDQLHHVHTIFGFRFKETMMVSCGALTFAGDFLIFLIYLVLNSHQNRTKSTDTSLIPEEAFRTAQDSKSFQPFNDIKIKKENCILLIPSDLVKCKKKLMDTVILMIGSLFTILCAFLNSLDAEIHTELDHAEFNHSFANESVPHDHAHQANHVRTVLDFTIINIDPILAIVMIALYLFFFGTILKFSCLILSQAVPAYIDIQKIKSDLIFNIPAIKNIHDLHLYEFNPFHLCISMHFVIQDDNSDSQTEQIARISDQITNFFHDKFFIYKVILEPEIVKNYDPKLVHGCILESDCSGLCETKLCSS